MLRWCHPRVKYPLFPFRHVCCICVNHLEWQTCVEKRGDLKLGFGNLYHCCTGGELGDAVQGVAGLEVVAVYFRAGVEFLSLIFFWEWGLHLWM